MLSYLHAFHAGNIADVQKHLCLTWCLESLNLKPKPYVYIDTHSGSGKYDFKIRSVRDKQKIQENSLGVQLLYEQPVLPECFSAYMNVIKQINAPKSTRYYPGSPLLASRMIRWQDQIHCAELHPTEELALKRLFRDCHNVRSHYGDGYKLVNALTPPVQKRGMVLIDPAYEVKTEFKQVIETIETVYPKWQQGTYIIWYPIVRAHRLDKVLSKKLVTEDFSKVLQCEWMLPHNEAYFNLIGTGVIIINPPWKLNEKMEEASRFLKKIGAISLSKLNIIGD